MTFDPQEFNRRVWVTTHGSQIRYVDLTEDHLVNIYHMLRRKAEQQYAEAAAARVCGKSKRQVDRFVRLYEDKKKRAEEMKRYLEWRITGE